ncbi:MAG: hypothetical protein AAGE43_20365 [Pseudomonadota bacterium]
MGKIIDWRVLTGVACLALLGLSGCTGSTAQNPDDASAANAASSETANATAPDPGPAGPDGPSVSLTATDLLVNEGVGTTLSWSSNGADSCTASGGWGGTVGTSGSQATGALTQATTFTLTCSGTGGSTIEMISVGIVGPVQLSWLAPDENVDGSTLTDLAGYRIYFGEASRNYSEMVELGDPSTTSHTLTLASGDYFVAMTALDADGNESGYSNEVLKSRL